MDADAVMKMVEDAFHQHCFIIGVIVSDDVNTMRDMIKHPSRGARGQVMNSFKGKIDEEIQVPSLLVDPSHLVKVVDKHTFSIVNNGKDK